MDIPKLYQNIFNLKNQLKLQQLLKLQTEVKSSQLLLHQLMYALGQFPLSYYSQIRTFLIRHIEDQTQFPIVRHQAAQALANYMNIQDLPLFLKYIESPIQQLRDTCKVASQKVKQKQLIQGYGMQFAQTKQPAAPFNQEQALKQLDDRSIQQFLLDTNINMFQRYRMMYYCRNKKNKKCIKALASLLKQQNWSKTTALLRHQVCFIFGQTGQITKFADTEIKSVIRNKNEQSIVKHEALNALSTYSRDKEFVNELRQSSDDIVRDTAILALQQIDYWQG